MKKVVAVINTKGGSGKTTVTTNISCGLQLRNITSVIGDTDPQGSARDWRAASGEESTKPGVYGVDRPELIKGIAKAGLSADVIFIDGAATDMSLTSAAIAAADFIIIPVNPSPYDIWACGDVIELINSRREVTNGLPQFKFLITRQKPNTKLSGEVRHLLNDIPEAGVFNSFTSEREIYKQGPVEGKSVFDSNNQPAINEMNLIINELLEDLE